MAFRRSRGQPRNPKAPMAHPKSSTELKKTPEGALEVIDVIIDSPASECDIRPGDAIVAVDGRAAARLTYDEVWKELMRDGARVNLTVDRGGVQSEKTLVLRRMI